MLLDALEQSLNLGSDINYRNFNGSVNFVNNDGVSIRICRDGLRRLGISDVSALSTIHTPTAVFVMQERKKKEKKYFFSVLILRLPYSSVRNLSLVSYIYKFQLVWTCFFFFNKNECMILFMKLTTLRIK